VLSANLSANRQHLTKAKPMTSSICGYTRVSGLLSIVTCFAAAAALAACGGLSSSAAAATSDASMSGPPVINPAFGARMPRKCNPVKHLPSEAEAAALAQCGTENGGEAGAFRPMIYLWQNVRVQMGTSRPYAYNADSHNSSIDTTSKVYPIRVTGDQLSCTGKATCMTSHADNAEGICYQTTFGDWHCSFSQVFGVTKSQVELPAPTTY
jgi:hypothetical protein